MTTDNNNPPAEREAFEEWFEADRLPLEHSNWFRRDDDGDYEISSVNISWRAWQARAALASHSASPPAGTRPLADLIAKYEADPAKAEKLAAARSALRGDAAAAREPLTEEQIDALWAKAHRVTTPMGWVVEDAMAHALARAVESAHGAFDVVRASALAAAEARADAAHEEWQGSQLMLELANTRAEAAEAERDALKAELAKHQESEFHPDWSMLEATRDSLREHMRMIREERAERDALRRALEGMCSVWWSVCSSNGWDPEHVVQYRNARAALASASPPMGSGERGAAQQREDPLPKETVWVLEALKRCLDDPMWADHAEISKRTLKAAIILICSLSRGAAQQEAPEPVAWRYRYGPNFDWVVDKAPHPQWARDHPRFEEQPLYTAPPALRGDAAAAALDAKDAARYRWLSDPINSGIFSLTWRSTRRCLEGGGAELDAAIDAAMGASAAPIAGTEQEKTRSEKLREAGFTRRKTGKDCWGRMRDPEDAGTEQAAGSGEPT